MVEPGNDPFLYRVSDTITDFISLFLSVRDLSELSQVLGGNESSEMLMNIDIDPKLQEARKEIIQWYHEFYNINLIENPVLWIKNHVSTIEEISEDELW